MKNETVAFLMRDGFFDDPRLVSRIANNLNRGFNAVMVEERIWRDCPNLMSALRSVPLDYLGAHILYPIWPAGQTKEDVKNILTSVFSRTNRPGPQFGFLDGLESLPGGVPAQREFVWFFGQYFNTIQSGPLVGSSSFQETCYEQNVYGTADQGATSIGSFLSKQSFRLEGLKRFMGNTLLQNKRLDLGWLQDYSRWELTMYEDVWATAKEQDFGITLQVSCQRMMESDPEALTILDLIASMDKTRELLK